MCASSVGIIEAPSKKKPNLAEPSENNLNPCLLGSEVPRNKNGGWVGARLYCKTETSKHFCPTEAHNLTQHLLLVCAQLFLSCGTLPLCLCVLLCPVAFGMAPTSRECCDDGGG